MLAAYWGAQNPSVEQYMTPLAPKGGFGMAKINQHMLIPLFLLLLLSLFLIGCQPPDDGNKDPIVINPGDKPKPGEKIKFEVDSYVSIHEHVTDVLKMDVEIPKVKANIPGAVGINSQITQKCLNWWYNDYLNSGSAAAFGANWETGFVYTKFNVDYQIIERNDCATLVITEIISDMLGASSDRLFHIWYYDCINQKNLSVNDYVTKQGLTPETVLEGYRQKIRQEAGGSTPDLEAQLALITLNDLQFYVKANGGIEYNSLLSD